MKTTMIFAVLLMCGAAQATTTHLVVDFKDDATMEQIHQAEKLTGLTFEENSPMWEVDKLMIATIDDSRAAAYIEQLRGDDDVEVVELEQIYSIPDNEGGLSTEEFGSGVLDGADFDVPNDKRYGDQWHMKMVGAEQAWKQSTGEGVVVAVLDTGVSDGKDKNFPRVGDLAQTEILPGYNFIDRNNRPNDGQGHGTHCASTIAESTNNSLAGVGLAFKAKILPVKVLSDQGSGSTAGIAEGIRWATDHGANIISMSLGGGGRSEVLENAIKYAAKHNVLLFCAAGNTPSEQVHYPSAYDDCMAISAVGPGGKIGTPDAINPKTAELATYSSYGGAGGKKGIFVAAPGGDRKRFGDEGGVWQATIAESSSGQADPSKWSFRSFNGTSMATPHVSGVAALVVSKLMAENGGHFKAKEALEILAETATPRDDKKKYGNGILNAAAAVDAAANPSHTGRWVLGGLAGLGALFLTVRRRR